MYGIAGCVTPLYVRNLERQKNSKGSRVPKVYKFGKYCKSLNLQKTTDFKKTREPREQLNCCCLTSAQRTSVRPAFLRQARRGKLPRFMSP